MTDLKRQRMSGPEMFEPQYYDPNAEYGQEAIPIGVGYGNMPMGPGMGDMGLGLERVFPCVKLRGLPYDVDENEIRLFLGCEPIDMVLPKRYGRFTGEAFIVLGSAMQVEMALAKNKTYMGRRYIEVFRAKKTDYYRAVVGEVMGDGGDAYAAAATSRGYGARPGGLGAEYDPTRTDYMGQAAAVGATGVYGEEFVQPTNVLKLRGLPFSVLKEDIMAWFDDPALNIQPLQAQNIHIITDQLGRPTGLALVEFNSPQDATIALSKHKQMMGPRYIEIFPSSREDVARYATRSY